MQIDAQRQGRESQSDVIHNNTRLAIVTCCLATVLLTWSMCHSIELPQEIDADPVAPPSVSAS